MMFLYVLNPVLLGVVYYCPAISIITHNLFHVNHFSAVLHKSTYPLMGLKSPVIKMHLEIVVF